MLHKGIEDVTSVARGGRIVRLPGASFSPCFPSVRISKTLESVRWCSAELYQPGHGACPWRGRGAGRGVGVAPACDRSPLTGPGGRGAGMERRPAPRS